MKVFGVFLIIIMLGVGLLAINGWNSHVDATGVLHESYFLFIPIGFLLISFGFSGFAAILALWLDRNLNRNKSSKKA